MTHLSPEGEPFDALEWGEEGERNGDLDVICSYDQEVENPAGEVVSKVGQRSGETLAFKVVVQR